MEVTYVSEKIYPRQDTPSLWILGIALIVEFQLESVRPPELVGAPRKPLMSPPTERLGLDWELGVERDLVS